MNRTVGNKAHAMRVGAGLPDSFWELAWGCAVFLRNRSPTVANAHSMTPYECMFGRKPDLGMLRVFGCRAEALVPKAVRSKGEDKSRPGIFVGYDELGKAYKFLPEGSRKWVPVRSLVCEERGFGEGRVPGVSGVVKPIAVETPAGDLLGEPKWHGEGEECWDGVGDQMVSEEQLRYEAQRKGENRPKLVAAKSLPMVTRSQLKKGLEKRYPAEEKVAMVGVDVFGAEMHGDGGMQLRVPRSVKEALGGPEGAQWREAIEEELKAMEDAEVWGPPVEVGEDIEITPLRFIFAKKMGPGCGGEVQSETDIPEQG